MWYEHKHKAANNRVGIIFVYECDFADVIQATNCRCNHIVFPQIQHRLNELTRDKSIVAFKIELLSTDVSATQYPYHFVRLYSERIKNQPNPRHI